MKILILASNPRKDLNLDREIRDLKDVIEKSRNQQAFEVEDALAVRVGDLQDLLHRHRPQIVHFCGHGSGRQGLVFEGNDGGEQWVRAEALSDLFRLFANNVGCVLLNACYSEEQADAIVNHIDYVIGMNQEIRDDAAIAFSKGFYRALGYECSIEEAYEFGRNAIQLEISGSSKMRSGVTEQQRKVEVVNTVATVVIPEHLKPILKRNPNLNPDSNRFVSDAEQVFLQARQEKIQLEVAKALARKDTNLEQSHSQATTGTNPFDRNLPLAITTLASVVLLVAFMAFSIVSQYSKPPIASPLPQPIGSDQTTRKVNQKGLELIMAFESLQTEAYTDGVGTLTIGYGTTKGVRRGMKISQAQAEELLKIDLRSAGRSVMSMVKMPLNDDQFSALTSFVYNVGPEAVAASTLLRVLNEGDYEQASDEFLIWDGGGRSYSPDASQVIPGLSLRRQAERALFLGYSPQPFIDAQHAK
jgi:GH24 family phage-related lysozyme (muramidase)